LYSLEDLGWSNFFQSQFATSTEDLTPARVAEEQRGAYLLLSEAGPLDAVVAGRMRHEAEGRDDYPAVGDWVLVRRGSGANDAVIHRVMGRRTKLSRKVAGERTDEQIMAANVDTVFLVAALNSELNIRRIERFLTAIYESGARPVIILNKADLTEDARSFAARVQVVAPAVEVHVTSASLGRGLDALAQYVERGQTVVFVGSSGVGKSSLVNRVMGGEHQAVRDIREDGKGRHTTTSRQMFLVPGGGMIIDTPGLRELQLWDSDDGIGQAFVDIEQMAEGCAFSDCGHRAEPGCAVQQALDDGRLEYARLESYRKLQREQLFVESKKDYSIRIAQKKKWKEIHKANRQRMKMHGR
jgi:ribosome biogenesis GTPase